MKLIKNALFVLMIPVFMFTSIAPAKAQTFAEWFSQKKTQKKYLLQQIAALQVYIGYAKKGYEIVGSGLQTVRDITNGEFGLHNAFMSGLKKVSPTIRNDVRVVEIIEAQVSIINAFGTIKSHKGISADQLSYISRLADGVISECYTDLEELLLVITSGKLEMKDDERLKRLNAIYERMLDKSSFTQSFNGDVALMIRQKEMEQRAIDNLRRYYEIN